MACRSDSSTLGNQVSIDYELPLAEVVLDFFDRLKSVSRGYASFDYQFLRFEAANLVKLDILINGERVDAMSIIVHRAFADRCGRQLVETLRKVIPSTAVRGRNSGGNRCTNHRAEHGQGAA